MNMKNLTIGLLGLVLLSTSSASTMGVFFQANAKPIVFAAGDIKTALEAQGHTVEMLELSEMEAYAGKKVVIGTTDDATVLSALAASEGKAVNGLKPQGFAIRSTNAGDTSFWAIGGDPVGAMYGALELAKKLQVYGISGQWNFQQNAYMKKRGVKFNIALDKRSGTYQWKDTEYINEMIKNVWDLDFWYEYLDEMARARYNHLGFWTNHPFTCMLEVQGYEDVVIEDVYDFKGKIKDMTIQQKNTHWKAVFQRAHDRGIDIYWMLWNLWLHGAEGKYGITADVENPATVAYVRKTMTAFIADFEHVSGFIIYPGENYKDLTDAQKVKFAWDTYGEGINDYQRQYDPEKKRDFNFIYRLGVTETEEAHEYFQNLAYPYDFEIKYSVAHAYTYPATTYYKALSGENIITQMEKLNKRFWCNIRNDNFFYLNWGNYHFARSFILNIPAGKGDLNKDRYVAGYMVGSDGNTETKTWYAKDSFHNGKLESKNKWYKWYAWGYAGYDPHRTEEDFKDLIRLKHASTDANGLYKSWARASQGLNMASTLVTGWKSWKWDAAWWIEGCTSRDHGWRSIDEFIKAHPSNGSEVPVTLPAGSDWAPKGLCGFRDYAADKCGNRETPLEWGERIKKYGLEGLMAPKLGGDKWEQLVFDDIQAMSFLSLYYSGKIRAGAHHIKGQKQKAIEAAAEAYNAWKQYAELMDKNYTGRKQVKLATWPNWISSLPYALDDYHFVGGVGTPEFIADSPTAKKNH